ncbi:MAG: trigger factor [Candidatus Sungbacteria bacterium]|nr:trigger factor [Candidatus Sungbacteria bacterium]
MKHTFSQLPKSEIEIAVTIPFSEFEPFFKKAAKLFSEEIEIPGFRKGHAPEQMVRERAGEMQIWERAADLAVRDTYIKILADLREKESAGGREFSPIGKPEVMVTKLAPGNDLEYKVKFAVLPEVKLPDYKSTAAKVKKGRKEVSVSEEEIAKSLEWLQNSRATLIIVDRPAAFGDRVEIDFEVRHGGARPVRSQTPEASADPQVYPVRNFISNGASRTSNGVKIEGGESKNHPFILGQGKFIPGFEDALLGVKAGEEKSFTLATPRDWRETALAGKALDFSVKMNLVQERKLPQVSDEFAKNLGGFESLEALKQNIREGLTSEKKDKESQRVRSEIISEIAKSAKIEVPQILVESELDKMLEELKSGVGNMGMKWEDYLLHIKKNQDELRREWQSEAERRVRIALCLREIAKIEKIEPTREEIDARANDFLKQFESVEEAAKKFDPESLREYSRGILRNERVFEFLEGV